MTETIVRRHERRLVRVVTLLIALFVVVICRPVQICFAQGPVPDPAGIATGDRTSVTDAAGNPFVVPEPTDKAAPDYLAAKKSYEEYQAQAAREPLATKLADGVGRRRDVLIAKALIRCAVVTVFQAVDKKLVEGRALTIDIEGGFAAGRGLVLQHRFTNAWREQHQIRIGASIER